MAERNSDREINSLVRVELDEDNSEKIRKIAIETNMSFTQVVNRLLRAVKRIEFKEIITYRLEVRSEEAPDLPGEDTYLRRKTNWAEDW